MKTKLIAGTVATVFLVIGIRCLVWPQQVLYRYLGERLRGIFSIKSTDIPTLSTSSLNIFIVRVFGALCVGISLIILYVLIKQLK